MARWSVPTLRRRNNDELGELAANLTNGVPIATPVFDGAHEPTISCACLKQAGLDSVGQVTLYDGRSGEASTGRSPWATSTC